MQKKITHKDLSIPYDLFQSSKEIVVLLPLWWVLQESIDISINEYKLHITAERVQPTLKDDLVPKQEKCYRWPISLTIDLPPNIYFDKIHSKLSKSNILTIVIPKNIIPDNIPIELEMEG